MVALLITDPIGAISTSLQNQPVSPQFKPTITITLNQFRWCHFLNSPSHALLLQEKEEQLTLPTVKLIWVFIH